MTTDSFKNPGENIMVDSNEIKKEPQKLLLQQREWEGSARSLCGNMSFSLQLDGHLQRTWDGAGRCRRRGGGRREIKPRPRCSNSKTQSVKKTKGCVYFCRQVPPHLSGQDERRGCSVVKEEIAVKDARVIEVRLSSPGCECCVVLCLCASPVFGFNVC